MVIYAETVCFPKYSKKMVLEALFLSVLDYGDVIYRHTASSVQKPLHAVDHSSLGFITGDKYTFCVFYSNVGWPSLNVRDWHWHLFIFSPFSINCLHTVALLICWSSDLCSGFCSLFCSVLFRPGKKVSRCTTTTSPGINLKGFCNWMLLFH